MPPVRKRYSDYSAEERAAFPRILEESEKVKIYEQDDIEERYLWDQTKTEKMGPIGSRQEFEFYKNQNFKEFHDRPGKKLPAQWLKEKQGNKFI